MDLRGGVWEGGVVWKGSSTVPGMVMIDSGSVEKMRVQKIERLLPGNYSTCTSDEDVDSKNHIMLVAKG